MNKDSNFLYKELSEKIIGAFYAVYDEMGYGFLEKVYELTLLKVLELRNIPTENQVTIKSIIRMNTSAIMCWIRLLIGRLSWN